MAVLKHIASKNADYSEPERYLVFQHDENTGKMILDADGYPIRRKKYILEGLNCNPATFAAECRKVNRQYNKNKDKKEIKTHHYIISFDPQDRENPGLTMEQAHELVKAFAVEHFPGHQMLICAHDDGHNESGNIHVHIVLNSLRMMDVEPLPYEQRRCDCKAGFKHNCTKDFMVYLRKDLMELCREQGLHQVDLDGANVRVTNEEYRAKQRGQEKMDREKAVRNQQPQSSKQTKFETEKERIRQAILAAARESDSPETFREILKQKYGIIVKESRGRWSYLSEGRQKPITGRKLGDAFEKEAVITAIVGRQIDIQTDTARSSAATGEGTTFVHSGQKSGGEIGKENTDSEHAYNLQFKGAGTIGKIINLEGNEKVQNSEAYARWIKIHNLQEQAKTFNFMSEHGLLTGSGLDQEYAVLTERFRSCRTDMKTTAAELKDVNRQLRLLGQYFKGKAVYREYCRGGKKPDFRQAHQAELELYDNAGRELREIFGEKKLPAISELKMRKAELHERKARQYNAFREVREQWMELGKIIQNRDSFLAKLPEQLREEFKTVGR